MSTATPGRRPSPLIITLIAVGGVLLLTVVALLFLLLGRGMAGTPTAATSTPTPTPTATPTAAPTPTPDGEAAPPPPPEDTTPRFTAFDAVTEVRCDPTGEQDKPEIEFSWATANAVEVWYTSGHEDAVADGYMRVPLAGSQADLTDEHLFECNHRRTGEYTLTLVGTDGSHVSQYWTVVDLNWQGDADDD